MYKIIGADRQEYGPSSAEELRQWVREGRANGETLVKAEGAAEWKPLARFPELASALAESPFGAPPPTFTAASGPADPQVLEAQILAANPDLRVGECLGRGWELLKNNFGLLFFATLSVYLVEIFLARLPIVRMVGLLITGVFQGGVYVMFLKRLRGQPAGVADAYSGFGEHFVQLLLAGIVSVLLTTMACCCLILPGIYLFVAWLAAIPLIVDKQLRFWDALELSRRVLTRYWFQMFLLVVIPFLPAMIFSGYVGIVNLKFYFSLVQSHQLDPSLFSTDPTAYFAQAERAARLAADKYFVLGLINQLVKGIFLPYAFAVVVQAYEILFNPRTAPPA